ncbi:MAG: glycosyltransferase family 39 protein [Anaerolineales bacterium]|nr:glycosyltransferase family 39 protein [Anaerolineales bacterium]
MRFRNQPLFGAALLLLLAAWARLLALDSVPPGWRDDEVVETTVHAALAAQSLPGRLILFFPQAEGHEPLYHYLSAGWIALAGRSLFSVRLLSVFLSLLSLAALYRLARGLFDAPVALLALSALAVSFWALMYARLKLRHVSELAPMLLAFAYLWQALGRPWAGWRAPPAPTAGRGGWVRPALLAGLWLGLGFYTYFAARAVPVILAAFALYLLAAHRPVFRARWPALALAGAVAGGLALPLAGAVAAAPGGAARLAVVGRPLLDLLSGDPRYALRNTFETLGMFAFTGDPEFLYNIPGRPVFGWGAALLFAGGVFLSLWRWRQPRYAFLLAWLVGGLAPAFVSTPSASLGHTIAAQPVVYIFPALALTALLRRAPAGRSRRVAGSVAALYLAVTAARDLPDYFLRWPALPEVRFLYRADLHAAGPALRALPAGADLALASLALHPADALALKLETPGLDLQPRTFSPARAWLFPAREARVLLRASAGASPFAPAALDGAPFALRSTRLAVGAEPAVALEAAFSNGWAFQGYTLDAASAGGLVLLTYWRAAARYAPPAPRPVEVLSGTPLPLKFFAHLLAPDGAWLVGDDRLDLDPATLRPGDTFIQRFEFAVPSPLPAGAYTVQIGLYDPLTGARLPLDGGGDSLRLTELSLP